MRAAIYLRISLDRTGEALGVARQLEDCTAAAAAAGWEVHEVFTDNDVSATKSRPRPAYRRMLAAVESGEIDAIVAWAPDRLYRRLADLEELIPLVERHGTTIRTCRAGEFDLATPLGKMIARILGAVATGEVDVKRDRHMRSVQQGRELGRVPGSRARMFGWDRDGRPVAAEAAAAKWMVEEFARTQSMGKILQELARRDLTTTLGNPWTRQAVLKYLRNPRLAGHSALRGEIVGTSTWPAIVDPDTWSQVRALLASRQTGRQPPRVALLAGLIYCCCGKRMITGARNQGRGGARIYRCEPTPGRSTCGRTISAIETEEIVEVAVQGWLQRPEYRARLAELRQHPQVQTTEIGALEVRIAELERQLDQPGVPVDTILRAVGRARTRQESLLAEVAASATLQASTSIADGDWPEDLRRRRALVDLAVERVTIGPSRRNGGRFDPHRVDVTRRPPPACQTGTT